MTVNVMLVNILLFVFIVLMAAEAVWIITSIIGEHKDRVERKNKEQNENS
jgi:hypothetical protein